MKNNKSDVDSDVSNFTNGDLLRSLPNKELASHLYIKRCFHCAYFNIDIPNTVCQKDCIEGILEWLDKI